MSRVWPKAAKNNIMWAAFVLAAERSLNAVEAELAEYRRKVANGEGGSEAAVAKVRLERRAQSARKRLSRFQAQASAI